MESVCVCFGDVLLVLVYKSLAEKKEKNSLDLNSPSNWVRLWEISCWWDGLKNLRPPTWLRVTKGWPFLYISSVFMYVLLYRSLRFFQNPKINKEICDQWLVTKYRQLHNFYTTKNVQIWSYELTSYILNAPNSTASLKSVFKLQKIRYKTIFGANM